MKKNNATNITTIEKEERINRWLVLTAIFVGVIGRCMVTAPWHLGVIAIITIVSGAILGWIRDKDAVSALCGAGLAIVVTTVAMGITSLIGGAIIMIFGLWQ